MITYITKNFVVMSLVAVVTILGLGFAKNSFAQSGGIGGPSAQAAVLTKDGNLGGGVTLGEFQLAPKQNQGQGSMGSLGNSSFFGSSVPKIFRLMGSSIFDFIAVHRDASVKKLYAGFTQFQQEGGGGFSQPSSSVPVLQVNGTIMVKDLANPSAAPLAPVCVNDAGIFTRTCPTGGTGGGIGGGTGGIGGGSEEGGKGGSFGGGMTP